MRLFKGMNLPLYAALLTIFTIPTLSFAADEPINAVAASQIFEKAKKNANWKLAFLTGKDAQVVFMSVTPQTNPSNEIGMETHKFDQVIFVASGNGKAVLNGKVTLVKPGDMIFIPQGIPHNVINLSKNVPLKIISVYSATDIPANAIYKKMSDVPQE